MKEAANWGTTEDDDPTRFRDNTAAAQTKLRRPFEINTDGVSSSPERVRTKSRILHFSSSMTSLLAEPVPLYGSGTSVGLSTPEVIQDRLDCRIGLVCPSPTKIDYSARAAFRMETVAAPHVGARKPGDRSQSLNCEPVSASLALRIRR